MQIFRNEQTLDGLADLRNAGQHAIGKYVFVDPGVASYLGFVTAYGMQKENPSIFETTVDSLHEDSVVFMADVFKHSDGDDLIE